MFINSGQFYTGTTENYRKICLESDRAVNMVPTLKCKLCQPGVSQLAEQN